MNWRFAYAIGFHPWEDTDPPFARKISELFHREEEIAAAARRAAEAGARAISER